MTVDEWHQNGKNTHFVIKLMFVNTTQVRFYLILGDICTPNWLEYRCLQLQQSFCLILNPCLNVNGCWKPIYVDKGRFVWTVSWIRFASSAMDTFPSLATKRTANKRNQLLYLRLALLKKKVSYVQCTDSRLDAK